MNSDVLPAFPLNLVAKTTDLFPSHCPLIKFFSKNLTFFLRIVVLCSRSGNYLEQTPCNMTTYKVSTNNQHINYPYDKQ